MSKNIYVLGAGLVGKAIAVDLAKSGFETTSVDLSDSSFEVLESQGVKCLKLDLMSDPTTITDLVKSADLVVGAVPGFMGFEVVKRVIEAGRNIVDISFFPEDAFELDKLAQNKNVTAVVDCGVAPGMGNIIIGYHNAHMEVESYECLVGGLPVKREWPYEYKAVFSPSDVIEEYTRSARFIQNGVLVEREALSDTELVEFPQVGTLESWNSDGLRSLIKTMQIPNMIEKTLRYPGTVEYLKVLRATGFFSQDPINVNGHQIKPIDVTASLLFPKWKLEPGEEEFTVMRIVIKGTEEGKEVTYEYMLLDRYNHETNTTSMARTTGYTCTAAVNLILSGQFREKGVCPPEYLGTTNEAFHFILDHLSARGVIYQVKRSGD